MIFLWCGLALAEAPRGVTTEVSDDVVVDWTRQVLQVRTTGRRHGAEGQAGVEEIARRAVDAGVRLGTRRLRVDRELTVDDLLDTDLAEPLQARMAGWVVTEVRYFASGRVGLVAELPLVDLLKPWTVARSQAIDMAEVTETTWTGVLVDARGTDASPAWAPRLVDSAGDVLFDGALREDVAVLTAPVLYVDDPAHPASTRAGENPLVVRAQDAADGCDLVLAGEDVTHLRRLRDDASDVLLTGHIVVVLGP